MEAIIAQTGGTRVMTSSKRQKQLGRAPVTRK